MSSRTWDTAATNGSATRSTRRRARAALRLGFTYEGVFRQHLIIKRRNRDTAWFSMLDSEWPARKAAFERGSTPPTSTRTGDRKPRSPHSTESNLRCRRDL